VYYFTVLAVSLLCDSYTVTSVVDIHLWRVSVAWSADIRTYMRTRVLFVCELIFYPFRFFRMGCVLNCSTVFCVHFLTWSKV
jgi:hypothetical protein